MTPKEVVKKSYEAFEAGDMATLASLCAADMSVKMGGDMPISGDIMTLKLGRLGNLPKCKRSGLTSSLNL